MIKKGEIVGTPPRPTESIPIDIMSLCFSPFYLELLEISHIGLVALARKTSNLRYLSIHCVQRIKKDILEEVFPLWKCLLGVCLCQYKVIQTTLPTRKFECWSTD